MKKTIKTSHFFLFAWTIVFISCKGNDSASKRTNTFLAMDSAIELKLQPAQTGMPVQYLYNTVNETNIEQEVNDEKTAIQNIIDVSMLYDVNRDSAGNYLFKITFKEFKVRIKVGGEIEKELKATTAAGSFDAQERIFAAFDKAVVFVKVDTGGKILAVDSLDRIQNKMYELARDNADAKNMIKTSLQQYVVAENFKKTFEQTFRMFPSGKLKPGYQWKANTIAGSDMNINVPMLYTLKGIDGNNGIVDIEGKIDFENQKIQVQGNSINISLKGEQNGEIKVDLSTGMISYSESNFAAKGKMFVLDNEVPVKMETSVIIKGVRVR